MHVTIMDELKSRAQEMLLFSGLYTYAVLEIFPPHLWQSCLVVRPVFSSEIHVSTNVRSVGAFLLSSVELFSG